MFYLSPSYFERKIIELLEKGNIITIKRYIREAQRLFYENIIDISPDSDEKKVLEIVDNRLYSILDNLVAMSLVFVEYNQFEYLNEVRQVFYVIIKKAKDLENLSFYS